MGTVRDHYLERIYELYGYSGRPFLKYAWREVMDNMITAVEAPTGYGKTSISQAFALFSLDNGFKQVVSYPLRTLLEDQYEKFSYMASGLGLGDIIGARYMHHPGSCFFVKPVTLTTIDTVSMTLFGLEPMDLEKALSAYHGVGSYDSITYSIGHYLFSRSSVLLSNIALDEVHLLADSSKSLNFLAALIITARQNGLKLLLMSATMPRALISVLKRIDSSMRIVGFDEDMDPGFVEERESKEINYSPPEVVDEDNKYDRIVEWLLEAEKTLHGEGLRALLVFNTVKEAVEMYDKLLKTSLRKKNIFLLHSRFRESERKSRVVLLEKLARSLREKITGGNGCPGIDYIVVATQVIEAGVDISSNVFITDIAPANSLIQRLGRFLRYPGENTGFLRIWYDGSITSGKNRYKVYDKGLVEKTLGWLRARNRFNPYLPSGYRGLLDAVYTINDFTVSVAEVEELVSLTLMLRSPRRAVEKFIELGGSYIRDSIMVPVIPSQQAMNSVENLDPIPLSVNQIIRRPRELIKGVLVKDHGGYRVEPPSKYGLDSIRGLSWKLMKLFLRQDVVALVINARYDIDKGLIING